MGGVGGGKNYRWQNKLTFRNEVIRNELRVTLHVEL